jgi:hypothetical protein
MLLFRYRNHEPQPSLSFEALFVNPVIISSNTAPLFFVSYIENGRSFARYMLVGFSQNSSTNEPFRSASARSAPELSRFAKLILLDEVRNY